MSIALRENADRVWTYEDYLSLPEDGNRYEIIDGILYVSPSPLTVHQLLSKRLQFFFYPFEMEGQAYVYDAPLDVHMPGCTPVQPDIIFLLKEQRGLLRRRGVYGAPYLLAEILSPGTARLDRVKKLNKYAAAGVAHYLLVDPEETVFEWLQLEGSGYRLAQSLGPGDHWTFRERTLDLSEFFQIPEDIDLS